MKRQNFLPSKPILGLVRLVELRLSTKFVFMLPGNHDHTNTHTHKRGCYSGLVRLAKVSWTSFQAALMFGSVVPFGSTGNYYHLACLDNIPCFYEEEHVATSYCIHATMVARLAFVAFSVQEKVFSFFGWGSTGSH